MIRGNDPLLRRVCYRPRQEHSAASPVLSDTGDSTQRHGKTLMSSLPDIPNFNVPLALRQLGNNVKLYNKLLDQFQKSYAGAAQEIANSVSGGDFSTAERTAHTIKGLAGSLGASSLQQTAANLEKLCREQVTGSDYSDTLAAFGKEMDAAIAGIRNHLAGNSAPAPQTAQPIDTARLAQQLAALAAHVDDNDAQALMLFDAIRAQVTAYDRHAATRIAAAFDVFDFADAAAAIASLRAKLG